MKAAVARSLAGLAAAPEAKRARLRHGVHAEAGKGHGRRETRALECRAVPAGQWGWPGLRQVFRVVRTRERRGKATREVAYGVTSLPPERAGAADLARLVRGHWGIENGLHWRRDVTMGEDACRARSGSAPQALAALRNLAMALHAERSGSLPAAIEAAALNFASCLKQMSTLTL